MLGGFGFWEAGCLMLRPCHVGDLVSGMLVDMCNKSSRRLPRRGERA